MITVYNPYSGQAIDVTFGETGTDHDTGDTVVAIVESSSGETVGNAFPTGDELRESEIAGRTMFFRQPLSPELWKKLFYGA